MDTDVRSTVLAEIDEAVELPCDLSTALELWAAWDKGVMPRAGGYLQQPRWWRALMRFLNSRHAPISAAYYAENGGKEGKQDDTTNWMEGGDDVGEPLSFERLKG